MRKAIAEQDKKIAELQKQAKHVKTQQDREKITQKFADEDEIFLAIQRFKNAYKLYEHSDFNSTINSLLKNCSQSMENYNQAIKLNPNDANAYYNLGLVYKDLRDYNKAVAYFSNFIQLVPDYVYAYLNRSVCYTFLKKQAKSDADFRKAKALGYQQ